MGEVMTFKAPVRRRTTVLSCCVAAALSLGGAAVAQELEEITVTAQKREQNLQDVGISVTAFTGEQLSELGVTGIDLLQDHTPNLIIRRDYGTIPIFNIRGVAFDDWHPSTVSAVTPYVDGIGIPYTVVTTGLVFDLEAAEVLRGPQGTLFGRNTTGGAMILRTAGPTEEFAGGITVEYGNFDRMHLEGFLSGPVTDSLGVRLAVSTTQSDGWIDGYDMELDPVTFAWSNTPNGIKLGAEDKAAVRLITEYDNGGAFTARLNLHYQQDKSDMIMGNTVEGWTDGFLGTTVSASPYRTSSWLFTNDDFFTPYEQDMPDRPSVDNDGWGAALNMSVDIGDVTLTSVTGYDEFNRNEFADWDGTAVRTGDSIDHNEIEFWSQELRLSSNSDGPLNWVIGAYIAEDTFDALWFQDIHDSVFPATTGVTYTQKSETQALFGQVEYELSDALRLTAGLRYTDDKKSMNDFSTFLAGDDWGIFFGGAGCDIGVLADRKNPDCNFFAGANLTTFFSGRGPDEFVNASGEWDATSGKLALDWYVSDDVMLYGSFSRGYKAGGFYGTATSVAAAIEIPYEPETINAYEFGFKSTLMDGRARLNGAVFYYDYEDRQFTGNRSDANFVALGQTLNQEEAEISGGEIEFDWQATDMIRLRQGIGYKRGEIKAGSPVNVGFGCAWDFVDAWNAEPANIGNELPNGVDQPWLAECLNDQVGQTLGVPHWTANGALTVNFPVGSYEGRFGIDYNYEEERPNEDDPELGIDAIFTANARIGITNVEAGWDLSLFVRNLADEQFYKNSQLFNNGLTGFPMTPRTYGLRLNYQF